MIPFNSNDFKFQRQDPNPYGYWEDEQQPSVKEVIIGAVLLILAFVLIGSVLFLN